MDLTDATYRVVVRGASSADEQFKQFAAAIAAADGMELVAGHGGGVVPPGGGPLPPVDTWSIYVKAETNDEAGEMVADAMKELEQPMFIAASTEAIDL